MNYGSRTSSWKPWRWMRLDLIFSMRDIYINSNLNPLTKFTSSSRSTEFKDILPWNISQMITKTIPVRTRIVKTYAMKQGITFWVWQKVNGNWDNNMIRISKGGKTIIKQLTVSKEKIQKSRTVRVTVRDPSRKDNCLCKVIWVRKIKTEFARSIHSRRIG